MYTLASRSVSGLDHDQRAAHDHDKRPEMQRRRDAQQRQHDRYRHGAFALGVVHTPARADPPSTAGSRARAATLGAARRPASRRERSTLATQPPTWPPRRRIARVAISGVVAPLVAVECDRDRWIDQRVCGERLPPRRSRLQWRAIAAEHETSQEAGTASPPTITTRAGRVGVEELDRYGLGARREDQRTSEPARAAAGMSAALES